ncbi:MAG: FAD-binding oxidoreductase [Cyanobacteria bacterium J06638_20]
MKTYDWIVVGAGLVGSAFGYELAKAGFSVLLLDRATQSLNATRYSYGGIAYWSGNTPFLRQLCDESQAIYQTLAAELDYDIQYRDLDLLLTVASDRDPAAIAPNYKDFRIPPTQLDPTAAGEIEPLLDKGAIAAAFHTKHGNVVPHALAQGYQTAMQRRGGVLDIATVNGFEQSGTRIQGVQTDQGTFHGANVLVCAGGLSRSLLHQAGISAKVYFTQAEIIETPPLDELHLQSIVMPAELDRMEMEAEATQPDKEALWDEPGHEVAPAILDAGALQYRDGSVRMGQTSRVLTNPQAQLDAAASAAQIRAGVGTVLPALQDVPGTWASCLVSFSGDRLPLIGALPNHEGLHLCAGFNGPFLLAPPLARQFAKFHKGEPADVLSQLAPDRFSRS